MRNFFYFRLALDNFKKNARMQIPFLLSSSLTVMIFYLVFSLSTNEGIGGLMGGNYVQQLLGFGIGVIIVFSIIFLFYTYSFLIKRRKREFGLFNILGMEKKHIARMLFHETFISFFLSLVLGILVGILFDKLMYMLLLRMIQADVHFGFYISTSGILCSFLLFFAIYVLIYVFSLVQVHIANPIELLNSDKVGEKEPKAKWILALIGLVCLITGYYMAVTITNPLTAFTMFFVAVILVVIGTYLLFTAGSVTLLKLLKKNKRYYYKTNHFISISNMIYRMKQNAIGLANICILSTMVLVMLSTTLSLWNGMQDILDQRYPREIIVSLRDYDLYTTKDRLLQVVKDQNIQVKDEMFYRYSSMSGLLHGNAVDLGLDQGGLSDVNDAITIYMIPLEDYNEAMHTQDTLDPGQVMIYGLRIDYEQPEIRIGDQSFQVKKKLNQFMDNQEAASTVSPSLFIVMDNVDTVLKMQEIQEQSYEVTNRPTSVFAFDSEDSRSQKEIASLFNVLNNTDNFESEKDYTWVYTECRDTDQINMLGLYAGFLFLGIFLSILFVIATVLIMYYKQITEGYQDKARFEIMEKVGLEKKDIRRSINSQVLTVFFLPLIVAGIHIAFALPLIDKLMGLLYFDNIKLFILTTAICFGVFALIYCVVYVLTSKVYYRIVKAR